MRGKWRWMSDQSRVIFLVTVYYTKERTESTRFFFFAQLCLVKAICQSKALIYDCAFGLGTRCKFAAVAMKSMTLRFGQGPKSAIESQLQCNWLLRQDVKSSRQILYFFRDDEYLSIWNATVEMPWILDSFSPSWAPRIQNSRTMTTLPFLGCVNDQKQRNNSLACY